MKLRLILAAALAAALAFTASGAQAAPPVLDGKKIKVLKLTAAGGLQTNDKDAVALSLPDKYDCPPERCKRLPFVYKPAKGVKGGVLLTATWANYASDIDLYLFEVQKNKTGVDVGHCGGVGTTTEKVYVDSRTMRSGKTYVLLVDFFRSVNETVNAKVEINVPNTIKETVPEAYNGKFPGTLYNVNCVL